MLTFLCSNNHQHMLAHHRHAACWKMLGLGPGDYSLMLGPFVLQAMLLVKRPMFHLTCCIAVPFSFAANALCAAMPQTYIWQRCPAVSTLLHVHANRHVTLAILLPRNRNRLNTIAIIFLVHEALPHTKRPIAATPRQSPTLRNQKWLC